MPKGKVLRSGLSTLISSGVLAVCDLQARVSSALQRSNLKKQDEKINLLLDQHGGNKTEFKFLRVNLEKKRGATFGSERWYPDLFLQEGGH